jgi:hypothetical protein
MQLGSQSTDPPGRSTHTFANIVGAAIALITLVLPLVVISHYTPETPPNPPPITQTE